MSEFEARPAARGTTVTVVVGNEERELKATKRKGGYAITPHDTAEAAALAQFSDEALDPAPAPDAPAEGDDDEADSSGAAAGEAPTFAAANAEADDGQEES